MVGFEGKIVDSSRINVIIYGRRRRRRRGNEENEYAIGNKPFIYNFDSLNVQE